MKRKIDNNLIETGKLMGIRQGLTLVEILMALLILALAVLPAIGAFSQYYGTATRQMEQEIALKLGEAVINVLMTTNYPEMARGEINNIPMNIQLPSGAYTGSLVFNGFQATGSAVVIGKANYRISANIERIFLAQNINAPHSDALEFKFPAALAGPGGIPPAVVATYSCFDDLLCIKVAVNYGPPTPIELATFRADMTR